MSGDNLDSQRKENVPGRSEDLILSSTEPVLSQPHEKKNEQPKKKKCRGNRKLQRFRAKLRRQGLHTEAIERLINAYHEPSQHDNEERREGRVTTASSSTLNVNVEDLIELSNQELQQELVQTKASKRKRETKSRDVTTSVSHVPIVQPSTKRQRSTTVTDDIIQLNDSANKSKMTMKPNYLKLPDHVFKKMLLALLEGIENTNELLDTPEKLQYARDYAHFVNDVSYLVLKQNFWETYYEVAITTGVWSLNMSKQVVKENNLRRIKFVTEENVEKHQKRVIEELKQAENNLNQHKQLTIDPSIDRDRLSTIIPAFVRQGQRKLLADFQRRKLLLKLDANDYHLVQAFYDLQPTEDQIISTKIIWQTTIDKQQAEEHVAILKKRVHCNRLPPSFNLLDHSVDNIEKILSQPILDRNTRATFSNERLEIIAKYKYDMMTLTVRIAEEMVHRHAEIISHEKKKLIDTAANGQVPLPKALDSILNAIAARQSNIIQRAQIITKQKVSFFDDAPTVV